jgi:hypothetical protein
MVPSGTTRRRRLKLEGVFGPDVFIAALAMGCLYLLPLWAIIDALSRPALAFYGAGSNRIAWVVVLVVATVLGLGWLFGGYYLLSVRRKVRRQLLVA